MLSNAKGEELVIQLEFVKNLPQMCQIVQVPRPALSLSPHSLCMLPMLVFSLSELFKLARWKTWASGAGIQIAELRISPEGPVTDDGTNGEGGGAKV